MKKKVIKPKKVVKKVKKEVSIPETSEMKYIVKSNQDFDVVFPGVPGIITILKGDNEITDKGEFKAKDLAEGIIKGYKYNDKDRLLELVIK